jgi:SAM-dependent methyltransferase
LAEFTGERLIPEAADVDLWNEHFARYAFAARLARFKRVLDAGCGTGYGAAELARCASAVTGLDLSPEAIEEARSRYTLPNLRFVRASCTALPFRSAAFDLVSAFEVIEHLEEWPAFLQELRRVLRPAGQCILSTPNKRYYTQSRGLKGPNPFHAHEFEFAEFRDALRKVFPHVSLFVQNHVEGFVVQPVKTFSAAEARVESGGGAPEDSHFFIAVCALAPQTGAPTFVYLPRAANILREREAHITLLEQQLAEKTADHERLLDLHRRQTGELEEHNRWAERLNAELAEARSAIARLDDELATKTDWALKIDHDLAAKCDELARCVEKLHQAEKTIEERTRWALDLRLQIQQLERQLAAFRASRWVRLGKAVGLGPEGRER